MALRGKYIAGVILFFTGGIAALVSEQPLIIILPFLVILFPVVFDVLIYKTKWIYYALIACIPLSTEINFTPTLGLDLPDELLMILLTSMFLIRIIYKPYLLPKKLFKHPLTLLLFLHITWMMISTVFSSDVILSVKFLLAKTWFIIPFVVLPFYFINNKKQLRLLCYLLLVPMAIVVIQALIRHAFFQFSFESVKEIYSPFFRNHVNFSGMLVCLLAVLFAMYTLTPDMGYRKLILAGLIIGFTSVILAYSRGAWAALIVAIAASWFIRKNVVGRGIIIMMIALISVSTWLIVDNKYLNFSPDYNSTIFHHDFTDHLQATLQFKDVSNAERFYRWIAGLNMIAEKPVTGFGPNNFYAHYRHYTETPFRTWVSDNPEHSSVHNYFLLTAIEQGVPGLLFFCFLYFAMLLFAQKLYHSLHDPFYKQVAITIGIILSIIGVLIFMSDLIETDKIGSIFWLCLGLLIMLREKTKNNLTGQD